MVVWERGRRDVAGAIREGRMERQAFLQKTMAEAAAVREFARSRGLIAYRMKGFHTKNKVVREEVIPNIAKMTCTTLIDPVANLEFAALNHVSQALSLQGVVGSVGMGEDIGVSFLYWVLADEHDKFKRAIAEVMCEPDWYHGSINVSGATEGKHLIEFTQDKLHGTLGEVVGYLVGLEGAKDLNDNYGWEASIAKANRILDEQLAGDGKVGDALQYVKLMRKRVGGEYAWALVIAKEDEEAAQWMGNGFDWFDFANSCGASGSVEVYDTIESYQEAAARHKAANPRQPNDRITEQTEDRTVMIFGAKGTEQEFDADALKDRLEQVLQVYGYNDYQKQVEVFAFTSRAGKLTIRLVMNDTNTATQVMNEKETLYGMLGFGILMRRSDANRRTNMPSKGPGPFVAPRATFPPPPPGGAWKTPKTWQTESTVGPATDVHEMQTQNKIAVMVAATVSKVVEQMDMLMKKNMAIMQEAQVAHTAWMREQFQLQVQQNSGAIQAALERALQASQDAKREAAMWKEKAERLKEKAERLEAKIIFKENEHSRPTRVPGFNYEVPGTDRRAAQRAAVERSTTTGSGLFQDMQIEEVPNITSMGTDDDGEQEQGSEHDKSNRKRERTLSMTQTPGEQDDARDAVSPVSTVQAVLGWLDQTGLVKADSQTPVMTEFVREELTQAILAAHEGPATGSKPGRGVGKGEGREQRTNK